MDTIFAISSGAPPAAIAIVRISGPDALAAGEALAGTLPPPRTAGVRLLRDPSANGEPLDRAVVLSFPGVRSATGEDLVELHVHGARAVVRAVEAALGAIPGLRRAEPGEFTRRALTNGRIDLSEAEGLGDLLMAETQAQRRAALRSAEGGIRARVDEWTARTLMLAAQVEAVLDHGDEEDVADSDPIPLVRAEAAALGAEIAAVASAPPIERLRDGIRVVLAGSPNAGKSTLLNALADRDAAIVTPIAGTTRDRIEAPVVREGTAYLLIDTAGITETPGDEVEKIGVERSRRALDEADILLWLDDAPPPPHPNLLWLHARADEAGRGGLPEGRALAISAKTGAGLPKLWDRIAALAASLLPDPDALALNARQRSLCRNAAEALAAAAGETDLLLAAEHLRTARRAFDAITGRAGVEAMLDSLFGRFCIGK